MIYVTLKVVLSSLKQRLVFEYKITCEYAFWIYKSYFVVEKRVGIRYLYFFANMNSYSNLCLICIFYLFLPEKYSNMSKILLQYLKIKYEIKDCY